MDMLRYVVSHLGLLGWFVILHMYKVYYKRVKQKMIKITFQ